MATLLLAQIAWWKGEFEMWATEQAKIYAVDPGNIFANLSNPVALTYVGEFEEAEGAIKVARRDFGGDSMLSATEALVGDPETGVAWGEVPEEGSTLPGDTAGGVEWTSESGVGQWSSDLPIVTTGGRKLAFGARTP